MAFACVGFPTVKTKNNQSFCISQVNGTFYYPVPDNKHYCFDYRTEVSFSCKEVMFIENLNNSLIGDKSDIFKEACNLTDSDIAILKDFVSNGYSVNEQNEEEYSIFLKEANRANEWRPSSCLAYLAVSHKGRWTGFLKGNDYKTGKCLVEKCGGAGYVRAVWNDLSITKRTYAYIFVPIIAVVLVTVLVLTFKRKKSD